VKSRESCIVITTTDSEDIANEIAGKLVEQRLAACVQVDKVKSFFIMKRNVDKKKNFA